MSSLETADRAGDNAVELADDHSTVENDEDGQPTASLGDGYDAVEGSDRAVPRRFVITLAVIVTVIRFAYAARRHTFSMAPDEMATVGMARFLSGGHWTQFSGNIYRPGLSTVIAPVFAIVDDVAWEYRLSILVNCLLGGLSIVYLVPLTSRLTSMGTRGVLATSGLIAVLPASLSASAYLWNEPLVTLSFLATALAAMRFCSSPTFRAALPVLLWPVVGYTSHGRLLPLVFLATALVVGPALRRKDLRLAAASGLVVGVSFVASYVYQGWLVREVWITTGSSNTSSGVIARLKEPLQVIDAAVGQIWYQLAASLLTVGFGVFVLVRRAVSERGQHNRDARVLLWLTLPLVGVSIVFMSDRARADHVIYGRYNDAILWPVIAVGAAWLFTVAFEERRKVRWLVLGATSVLTAELCLLLLQLHHLQFEVAGVEPMIAGITPALGDSKVRVIQVTAVALCAFALLAAAAKLRPKYPLGAAAVVFGLVAVAGVRGWEVSDRTSNSWARDKAVQDIDSMGMTIPRAIGVSIMPEEFGPAEGQFIQVAAAMSHQWFLPNHEFVFDNGPRDEVGPYVFAVSNDALLTRDGGTIVWLSPSRNIALWLEPETLPDGDPNPAYANLTADQP